MRPQASHRRKKNVPALLEALETRTLLSLTHLYTFNNGNANDSVGTAHGTLFNGAVVANGKLQLQNAGRTSGASNVQYARLPNGILPNSGSATIEVYYTTFSNTPNWMRVFDFGNGPTGSYLFYTPKSSSNDARVGFTPAGGTEIMAATAAGTTAAQAMQNVATTVVDAAAGTISFYLNGALVQSAPLNGQTIAAINEVNAYLGRSQYTADAGFSGAIDEVRIYDEALSAAAIAGNVAAGPAVPTYTNLPARQVEKLNRGVVALPRTAGGLYVSWRLLGTDAPNTQFNLYRSTNNGAFAKVNGSPIALTTDYQDGAANRAATIKYYVKAVVNGVEGAASETFTFNANSTLPYLRIPLQIPAGGTTPTGETYTYAAGDASVGDVDGDGQYEIILKWDPSNAKDNSQAGYTGNVYIDAYRMDGTRLWRIDMGVNIRAGAHYTQFQVYDFDGDGKAEVAMKTAPGTKDGVGNFVLMGSDAPTADYRNGDGYILTGPEYLTVFNGLTGAAMDTEAYTPARGSASQWGDGYGNRVDRFLAGVAYIDGQRPSLIESRGYYPPGSGSTMSRNEITAWNYRNGQLTRVWYFQANRGQNNNINSNFIAQGAHSLSVADVDGDGKDEIIYGSSVIDDDGRPLWASGAGHGDALHVSDMDPERPGQEVFMVHEAAPPELGGDMRDARTGELIHAINGGGSDVGRGVAFDIDGRTLGFESWVSANGSIYDVHGNVVSTSRPGNYNFGIWWDADPLRELLDGNRIDKWNTSTNSLNRLLTGTGSSVNGTKATPVLSGDLLGDWREEVIWRASDNTALHLYTTTTPSSRRLFTLMHDLQYRAAVAWQNSAYNQPPHTSFYLGQGMVNPPMPNVYAAELPAVAGTAVQNGEVQRSTVTSLTVTFSTQVTLSPGALSVVRREADGSVTPIPVTAANPSGDGKTYVLSFGGASLTDGDYELRAAAAGVRNLGNIGMTSDFTLAFHRLLADANGDKKVDSFDLNILAGRWQTAVIGGAGVGDFNEDGMIDSFDLNILAAQWQKGVILTGSMTAEPFFFSAPAPVSTGEASSASVDTVSVPAPAGSSDEPATPRPQTSRQNVGAPGRLRRAGVKRSVLDLEAEAG